MKNIKSFFKLLFIYSLVLCLVFSASIKIDALNSNSNKSTKSDKIVKVDNNKQNKVQIEENVGKILDKYTGYTDNFEEKMNSQDFKDITDITAAMVSRYKMATVDEKKKFDGYIKKAIKKLKDNEELGIAYELERQYKILSNKEKYVNSNISLYSVKKYPELFENLPEGYLEKIEENYEVFKKFGDILDKYSDNKENYREKGFSLYSKDMLDNVRKGIEIYETAEHEEREDLDYYISNILYYLKSDYPHRYSYELEDRLIKLRDKERNRYNKFLSMRRDLKNISFLMLQQPVSTVINIIKDYNIR
ncbi:hypothetical protein HMPREF1142_0524 [Peptostreptococcaceae bacterium AS15]|nr:hypothetical protein HMPREF1142_0524 [Peptostreptococcaceae bacterium AS15]